MAVADMKVHLLEDTDQKNRLLLNNNFMENVYETKLKIIVSISTVPHMEGHFPKPFQATLG